MTPPISPSTVFFGLILGHSLCFPKNVPAKYAPHIPVIMLSSEDSTTERIRLLEIGAEDYIVKPFNPMELKIRVKKIIE